MSISTKEFNELYSIIMGTHQEVEELYKSVQNDDEFMIQKRDMLVKKLRELVDNTDEM